MHHMGLKFALLIGQAGTSRLSFIFGPEQLYANNQSVSKKTKSQQKGKK